MCHDLIARSASLGDGLFASYSCDLPPPKRPQTQAPLVLAYYLGGPVGRWLTRCVASLVGAPVYAVAAADSVMNYPYPRALGWVAGYAVGLIPPRPPKLPPRPTLYVYASDKPFQMQSREWLAAFGQRSDGACRGDDRTCDQMAE